MRTPEVSFWDLLNSGYYIALGTMLREELQRATGDNEHDSWKQVMLDSLNFSNLKKMIEDRLPEREEVKMLQGLIGICILENSETILDGRELSAIGGNGILEYMDMLKNIVYNGSGFGGWSDICRCS